MTIAALLTWMKVAQLLIPVGIATEQEIMGWIRAKHGTQMTDAEMNVALAMILDSATRQRAVAIADALGHPAPSSAVSAPPQTLTVVGTPPANPFPPGA